MRGWGEKGNGLIILLAQLHPPARGEGNDGSAIHRGKPTSSSPGHVVPIAAFLAVCGLVSTLTGLHLYLELGLASGATAVWKAALCFGLGMAASPPRWRA
jgi:hypothetical protein